MIVEFVFRRKGWDGMPTNPLVGARSFRRGLSDPGYETRLAESRAIAGNECLLAHFDSVVARLRVCDNLARILFCGQVLPGEFIETKLFRSPYFNGAIHRRARRDPAHRTGDIVRRHRLDKRSWQAYFV